MVGVLMEHKTTLKPGVSQLNWCDRAIMVDVLICNIKPCSIGVSV